eukprot:scaffold72682_cov30-Tisochrysis_lutea.AAC.2
MHVRPKASRSLIAKPSDAALSMSICVRWSNSAPSTTLSTSSLTAFTPSRRKGTDDAQKIVHLE